MNHFLKTIYLDTKKLWSKSNIDKLYWDELSIERSESSDDYIKNIDIFNDIEKLELKESITYFVWENWTWKSTLLEHVAVKFGFNNEGGTINSNYKTNRIDNIENDWIRLSWKPTKFKSWYFFRAEGVYNFINYLQDIDDWLSFVPYWWKNLHKFSHGQQFIKILESMIDKVWFYILDEFESALSPANQLKAVEIIKYMASKWSQFLIATHSPIILWIKQNSQILSFDNWYIHEVDYNMVWCVDIYKRVLLNKNI